MSKNTQKLLKAANSCLASAQRDVKGNCSGHSQGQLEKLEGKILDLQSTVITLMDAMAYIAEAMEDGDE